MQALKRIVINAIVLPFCLGAAANAVAAFSDDFEDGNYDGWFAANNGGISSDGVELHNSSLMAYAYHIGNGSPFGSATNENSLSRDFAYVASDILSFDMHPVATSASTCCIAFAHGKAGVTVTLLNAFNIPLGTAGLYYATNAGLLAANEYAIESVQRHFEASMDSFASLAGLSGASPIARISLTFKGLGQFVGGGNIYPNASGTGKVWFDNVNVSVVPEPATSAYFAVGLILVLAAKRTHSFLAAA